MPVKVEKTLFGLCSRCNAKFPIIKKDIKDIIRCPECRSPYWNRKRTRKVKTNDT